jgi:hypothetical protein
MEEEEKIINKSNYRHIEKPGVSRGCLVHFRIQMNSVTVLNKSEIGYKHCVRYTEQQTK